MIKRFLDSIVQRSSRLTDPIRQAFARLTEREQMMVLGGAAGAGLVALLIFGVSMSSAISAAEHRVKVKSSQLSELLQLQGLYKVQQRKHAEQLQQLGRSRVRLVSMVEQVARDTGVQIGQLRPEDSEPTPDGIVESRVDLRASGLSPDRLQKFLAQIEKSPGIVVARRLKLDRPYKKDTLDMEMTVITFKPK